MELDWQFYQKSYPLKLDCKFYQMRVKDVCVDRADGSVQEFSPLIIESDFQTVVASIHNLVMQLTKDIKDLVRTLLSDCECNLIAHAHSKWGFVITLVALLCRRFFLSDCCAFFDEYDCCAFEMALCIAFFVLLGSDTWFTARNVAFKFVT